MNKQKVLIVGGAGYIGGYLTDFLTAQNYAVTVFDNLIYETRYLKRVPFIYGDIRDQEKLATTLPNFDIVIWLAGIVGDGACAVDPTLSQEINEDSVKWLVDNYKGKIVFTSTCSVYGINNDIIDEEAKTKPLSVYATTKLNAEQYIVQNAKDYLVFRLGTLFGLSDDHSRIRLDLVANILTKKAVMHEKLTVYGGEQWRPLLHVRDVATAIDFGIKQNITGLFNLSCANYKISQIAEVIKKEVADANIEYVDKKFEDLRNYKVKNDKFLQCGWKPQHELAKGIKEMVDVIGELRIKNLADPIYSNEFYLGKYIHHIQQEYNFMNNQAKLLKGGVAVDDRGYVSFVNDFDFNNVKRFYQVENHSINFIRAWHGHKKEGKYVYVPKGSVLIGAVNLETEEITKKIISSKTPSVLWIPPNHANGFMNLEKDTIIQFFSTSSLEDSLDDDIRFPWDKWNIWHIEKR